MALVLQGLRVCGDPSEPSQAVGCQGQWGTCALELCVPILGLPVPLVTGCPVPARCSRAGQSCDQGKVSPPLGPGTPGGSERETCLAPLPEVPLASAQHGDRHCGAGRGVYPGHSQGCSVSPSPVPGGLRVPSRHLPVASHGL